MTNFEYIKNMDIETLACFLARIKKKNAEEVAEILGVNYKVRADVFENAVAHIIKYLATERDTNV